MGRLSFRLQKQVRGVHSPWLACGSDPLCVTPRGSAHRMPTFEPQSPGAACQEDGNIPTFTDEAIPNSEKFALVPKVT